MRDKGTLMGWEKETKKRSNRRKLNKNRRKHEGEKDANRNHEEMYRYFRKKTECGGRE